MCTKSGAGLALEAMRLVPQSVGLAGLAPKVSTRISMSVFPRLFLFYRVFGCFLAMGVQKHYEARLTKKIVSKSFNKKFDQKPQTDFFSIFLKSRFWAFLGEGSALYQPPTAPFVGAASAACFTSHFVVVWDVPSRNLRAPNRPSYPSRCALPAARCLHL
jgi:hypothetical protein